MNTKERERIIKDIINHQIEEEEVGEGNEYTRDVNKEYKKLNDKSDSELDKHWHSTVGEWIAHMARWNGDEYLTEDDIEVWLDKGYDTVIDWQFHKLITTGKTDYGYMSYRYEQPY